LNSGNIKGQLVKKHPQVESIFRSNITLVIKRWNWGELAYFAAPEVFLAGRMTNTVVSLDFIFSHTILAEGSELTEHYATLLGRQKNGWLLQTDDE